MSISTLQRVHLLFDRLPVHEHHRLWLRFVDSVSSKADAQYRDDGEPVVFATQSNNGVNLCCYRWLPRGGQVDGTRWPPAVPPKELQCRPLLVSENWGGVDWTVVKGAVFVAHGVTDHSRFMLLRLKTLNRVVDTDIRETLTDEELQTLSKCAKTTDCELEVEGSWLASLLRAGYAVYAMEMQGHGLAGAWLGSRCNVEHFTDYIEDVLAWLTSFFAFQEIKRGADVFLCGLSMGGCVATRTVQLGVQSGRLKVGLEEAPLGVPRIRGLVLFCPALSAERLKRKTVNKIVLPVGKFLSERSPRFKVAGLETNKKFPYLNDVLKHDALVYSSMLPSRISYEILLEIDKIMPEIDFLPAELALVLIQSEADTMTDPEGSQAFIGRVLCKDKEAIFLKYAWHFLSKEPGAAKTIQLAIDWMKKRTRAFF